MKVLMFGWEFPPVISGGLGTACQGITRGLAANGVEVLFVMPTTKGNDIARDGMRVLGADEVPLLSGATGTVTSVERTELSERIKALAVRTGTRISPYHTAGFWEEYFDRYFDGKRARLTARQRRQLQRSSMLSFTGNYGEGLMNEVVNYGLVGRSLGLTETFDVIHAHDWMAAFAGAGAKAASGRPLVVHVHATEFDRSGEHVNQAVYDIERFGMEAADRIIAVSHFTRNVIVERYGISPDKVSVVHNAVSKERRLKRLGLQRPLDGKMVLFLGRVTMQKGPDYFIEAAHLVARKMKDVRFVMAGAGDMLPRMITRMAELRMASRFHFTGFLRGAAVEKAYALSDLYIMPSVSEPFGLTPFEAILYDVPIIISKQSGAAELLSGALHVDFWDVEKLAESIITVLSDDVLAGNIVERCRDDIRNVTWDVAARNIRAEYDRVLGR